MCGGMTADEVRALLREEIRKAGTAKAWGDANRVSLAVISETIHGHREPAFSVIRALGLKREKIYHPISQ